MRILRGPLGALLQGGNNRTRPLPLGMPKTCSGLRQLLRVHPGLAHARHQVTQLRAKRRHRAHLLANILGPGCFHGLQQLGQQLILGRARHQLHALQRDLALSAPRRHHLIRKRRGRAHRTYHRRAERLRARRQYVSARAIRSENQRGMAPGDRLLEHRERTRTAPRRRCPAGNHIRVLRSLDNRALRLIQRRKTPPTLRATPQPDLDFAHDAILADPTHICGTYDGRDDIFQQGVNMEIFIGIRDNTRQLGLDVDMTEGELMAKVHEALTTPNGVLDLTDTKGQRTLVPANALGYVQIASKTERRVGFAIH